MKLKNKPTLLFFFIFCVKLSCAQDDLSEVQDKLLLYTKTIVPEKTFLHADKNFYSVGEIVWFKLYVVDGMMHKPLPASKVAYVEIIDGQNTPAARAKLALDERGGSGGSLLLPLNLRSGNYKIRAYTNWMKNTGAGSFFEKQITIVNPLRGSVGQPEEVKKESLLKLFPEGGNLVNGLTSKVAFHVTDHTGRGVEGIGYLINNNNDTLSSFRPHKFGMGHFELTPGAGNTYKVLFTTSDGNSIIQELPESFYKGYVMQLEEKNGQVWITVKTNTDYSEVYLLAQTRHMVKSVQRNKFADGSVAFTVNKKLLGEGVSQFTVFDGLKRPVCERLFFIQPSKKDLNIRSSKNGYSVREKVDLSIEAKSSGKENMSLSVFLLDELESTDPPGIDQYVWLTSEINGMVEQPSFYFSAANEEVRKASDYLMLIHGWRRFKWDTVFSKPVIKFPRESSGHLVTGRVTDTRTNIPGKNIPVFLSIPQSPQKLFVAVSDSLGLVEFNTKDYFGAGEIIAQTLPEDSFYRAEIFSPFAETYSDQILPQLKLSREQQNSLLARSIGMQVQHIYTPDSLSKFSMPLISDSLPFYGRPLRRYRLDDYKRFNTMEEVLREYVTEINVGVKGSGTSLRFKLFNETYRENFTDNLLVLVDGIPVDPNHIFALDPLKIKRLEIVNRNYVFGGATFRGLANFSSYDGPYEGLSLNPGSITIDYEGMQLQREFYAPDYSSDSLRNSRLPDFRTTLFWMPDVHSGQISFFTGDNKGRYLVVLQGIDENGQAIHAQSRIEVK